MVNETMQALTLILSLIIAFLFLLSFFQFVLAVQANLKDNQWQIGVLRAMGMNQGDVRVMTLVESTSVILSAIVLGFGVGYVMTVATLSVIHITQEMPIDYSIDWKMVGALFSMALLTVNYGTDLCISQVSKKKITAILKGD
uniref:ABC3 transporter permease C-terminal domain-containing protein n=1 Tax=Strombidium rassoulzadegani TaxID=1082188 RepID=A0A7S3CSM5_9SPIT|mmetsp:Transcript_6898/g.11633  ORF Transcript_6898/g.11633 Transcript_6898/m.11633 type:complete len:142 (+) Transcript_6898:361-786(+)